jgi:hypothetical protein
MAKKQQAYQIIFTADGQYHFGIYKQSKQVGEQTFARNTDHLPDIINMLGEVCEQGTKSSMIYLHPNAQNSEAERILEQIVERLGKTRSVILGERRVWVGGTISDNLLHNYRNA